MGNQEVSLMKTAGYAAAICTLLFLGPALAETTGGAQPPPSPYESGFQDGMRAAMAHLHGGMAMDRMGHMGHMGHMGGMGEGAHGGEKGGCPAKGTHFEFERGDARIEVRCSPQETAEDCVTAAITLLDRVEMAHAKAVQQPAAPVTAPPAPPPGQPQH